MRAALGGLKRLERLELGVGALGTTAVVCSLPMAASKDSKRLLAESRWFGLPASARNVTLASGHSHRSTLRRPAGPGASCGRGRAGAAGGFDSGATQCRTLCGTEYGGWRSDGQGRYPCIAHAGSRAQAPSWWRSVSRANDTADTAGNATCDHNRTMERQWSWRGRRRWCWSRWYW